MLLVVETNGDGRFTPVILIQLLDDLRSTTNDVMLLTPVQKSERTLGALSVPGRIPVLTHTPRLVLTASALELEIQFVVFAIL
jgi:hypothetical protein